jgi:hypothetical protein
MAYPTVSAPYGFEPINRRRYALRWCYSPYSYCGAYNTAIFAGDMVQTVAAGTCREVHWHHYWWYPVGVLCWRSIRQFTESVHTCSILPRH